MKLMCFGLRGCEKAGMIVADSGPHLSVDGLGEQRQVVGEALD
ncbi:MAG: hypothetical protein PHQ05_11550 [Sterolibacterium sp.]|nr:hypothetical protein [Sterolibacterium sp.]